MSASFPSAPMTGATTRNLMSVGALVRIAVLVLALGFVASEPAVTAELPKVRAGVLTFGTVNWELDVVKHHGLDRQHGVDRKSVV